MPAFDEGGDTGAARSNLWDVFTSFFDKKRDENDMTPDQQQQINDLSEESQRAGAGLPNPHGYYEETIFGTATWHSTNGGPDLHGAAARHEASKWLDDVDDPGGDEDEGDEGGPPGRGPRPGSDRPGR